MMLSRVIVQALGLLIRIRERVIAQSIQNAGPAHQEPMIPTGSDTTAPTTLRLPRRRQPAKQVSKVKR